jgi:hypothetical protein
MRHADLLRCLGCSFCWLGVGTGALAFLAVPLAFCMIAVVRMCKAHCCTVLRARGIFNVSSDRYWPQCTAQMFDQCRWMLLVLWACERLLGAGEACYSGAVRCGRVFSGNTAPALAVNCASLSPGPIYLVHCADVLVMACLLRAFNIRYRLYTWCWARQPLCWKNAVLRDTFICR